MAMKRCNAVNVNTGQTCNAPVYSKRSTLCRHHRRSTVLRVMAETVLTTRWYLFNIGWW
jgi:hypothetical protein